MQPVDYETPPRPDRRDAWTLRELAFVLLLVSPLLLMLLFILAVGLFAFFPPTY